MAHCYRCQSEVPVIVDAPPVPVPGCDDDDDRIDGDGDFMADRQRQILCGRCNLIILVWNFSFQHDVTDQIPRHCPDDEDGDHDFVFQLTEESLVQYDRPGGKKTHYGIRLSGTGKCNNCNETVTIDVTEMERVTQFYAP